MNLENHVLVLPGLSGDSERVKALLKNLNSPQLNFHLSTAANWNNFSEDIQAKINRIESEVDELSEQGKVSIIGISGSGSLAGLVYLEREGEVERVINVCGRLRPRGIPPLWLTSLRNPTFKKSVLAFQEREPELTESDRRKFLIFQAKFDELVPGSTSYLKGAQIIHLSAVGHMCAIKSAFLEHGNQMIDFLR